MTLFHRITLLIWSTVILISCDLKYYNIPTPAMLPTIKVDTKVYLSSFDFERHSIVLFNNSQMKDDNNNQWISRIVGIPGDSLYIEYGDFILNNKPESRDFKINRSYTMQTNLNLDYYFKNKEISDYHPINFGYKVHCTDQQFKMLQQKPTIDTIYSNINNKDFHDQSIHFYGTKTWNKDFFGPIYIPKKGDVITQKDFNFYRELIEAHEGILLNEQESYTIKYNYYFLSGDNRDNTLDSRYIGLIPGKDIKGSMSTF